VVRKPVVLLALLGALALSLPATRAALAGNEIWQEKAYLPGMSAIATGVIAALLARRHAPRRIGTRRFLCVLGCTGIALNLLFGSRLWGILGNGLVLVLTASAGLLLFALHEDRSRVPRGWRWLASMGRLSYDLSEPHVRRLRRRCAVSPPGRRPVVRLSLVRTGRDP